MWLPVPKSHSWGRSLGYIQAEIPYVDSAGPVADFHGLRHTFITNVVKGGASPKVAQALARHSKITLTMDTYTHIGLHDQRAALEGLPALPCINKNNSGEDKSVALKTGTDDRTVGAYKELTKKSDFDGLSASSIGTADEPQNRKNGDMSTSDKSLQVEGLGTKR